MVFFIFLKDSDSHVHKSFVWLKFSEVMRFSCHVSVGDVDGWAGIRRPA